MREAISRGDVKLDRIVRSGKATEAYLGVAIKLLEASTASAEAAIDAALDSVRELRQDRRGQA